MKIAICDDDTITCEMLETIIDNYCKKNQIQACCEVFLNAEDLLQHSEAKYLVYFLDIEMEGINGLELANTIRESNDDAIIIFVTSHKELMQEAFEVLAFHFILKPFSEAEVERIFEKAMSYINRKKDRFFYKIGKSMHSVLAKDIIYIENRGRKLLLHTKVGQEKCYLNMKDTMEQLDRNLFAQIHVSFIVNMEQIKTIEKNKVELHTGEKLPISRKYVKQYNDSYRNFVRMRTGQ